LAKADGTEVTKEHINRTIRVCMEFVDEMAANNKLFFDAKKNTV
jgi:hypothetical protein